MASGVLLLPSVNRNFPRIVTQSPSGIIAYASRAHIYFVDARSNPPVVLDSKFIFGAHSGMVISLAFCKYEGTELLASIGDDREIKIWDVVSQTCVQSATVKECTRVAEWLHGSSNTLVYASEPRVITKWNIEREVVNGVHKVKTGIDLLVTQIASNEKSPHLLAVGYLSGTIMVMNIHQEIVLHRLKVHTKEITSLSWSPVTPDMLLSASQDLSLRMWKVGETQPIWSHYMSFGRQRMDLKKIRIIGICHPTDSNTIICSNLRGDVGEIVFGEKEKPKFENEKSKFSYYYQGNCDLSCKSTFAFFLISTEKSQLLYCLDPFKVTVWDVTKKRLVSQIPFMCQFVYDLTVSNLNPNLLSISNGEGILKVWNSQSEATRLDMISVYIHFKTRIMTTAWHPINENLIAYGTDEGRVGIIDIVKRKPQYTFETHHAGAVYGLSWGPCEKASKPETESGKTEYYIYSVGSGVIYIHKENNAKVKALSFEDLVELPSDLDTPEKNYSEICWKSDYSCVCIASYKGYIDLYDSKFVFLNRFTVQLQTVEFVRWHPQVTYMSPEGSHLQSWFAANGNDTDIYVVDTSNFIEEYGGEGAMKKLVGHKKRVTSLCWSQHKDGFLVSSSKDGSVLVWDVLVGNIIATYLSHQDIVYTVQWCVFDQDVIYSGGQDGSVRFWKISEQKVLPISEKGPQRKKLKKPSAVIDLQEKNSQSPDADALSPSRKEDIKKGASAREPRESTGTEGLTSKKSLFPQYSMSTVMNTTENLDDCIRLADILSENPMSDFSVIESFESWKSSQRILSKEDIIKFGLFSDQLTALSMCETQGDLHKAAGDQSSSRYVQIIAGNTKTTIEEAAETGTLNHFLVSMAPSVSYSFWIEICEKFAAQLAKNHMYNQACFYYLACGKIYEAINVLSEKGYIVEALALAKSRLPETDPLIPRLVRKLIKLFGIHSKVGVALCYLSLNEALSAAKTIASADEPNYARVAAYICRKFNLSKEAEEYRFLCLEKCLMKYNYSVFKLLVKNEPCMQAYGALVSVHEALTRHVHLLKKQDFVLYNLKEMFELPENLEEVCFWKGISCRLSSEESFPAYVQQLMSKELLDTEEASLVTVLDALEAFTAKRMTVGTNDVHITIAVFITKFIIWSLLEYTDSANEAFLKIFEASHDIGFFPKIMSALFFPMRLSWQINASRVTSTYIPTKEIANPFLQTIQLKVIETVTNYIKQPLEAFINLDDLQSNLNFIATRISVLLAIRGVEDYLVAYFASSYINDLMKLLEKKELNIKCCGKIVSESKENGTIVSEQNDNVEDIIKLALQEAEEKAKMLSAQTVIKSPQSPDDKISSILVENSFDIGTVLTDVHVQSASQMETSQSPLVDIASAETEKLEKPFDSNIDATVGENLNISNGSSIPELNTQDTEYSILSNDNLVDNLTMNEESLIGNNGPTVIDQTKSESNSDVTVASEVSAMSTEGSHFSDAISSEDLLQNENMNPWLQLLSPSPEIELIKSEKAESTSVPTLENYFPNKNLMPSVVPGPQDSVSNLECPVIVSAPTEKQISHTDIPYSTSEKEEYCHEIQTPTIEKDQYNHESTIPSPEKDTYDHGGTTVSSEKDPSNHEITTPSLKENLSDHENTAISPEKNLSNNKAPTPEKDLSSFESATSVVPTSENCLSNKNQSPIPIILDSIQSKEQEINNVASIPEDPNKKHNRISNAVDCSLDNHIKNTIDTIDIASEIMRNGNVHCTNEIIHTQCLRNIDMFYNMVSFVAQSICKDEFALLYYLKEKVKLLKQLRASEGLNKFSKEKKVDTAEASIKVKKSKQVPSNLEDSVLMEAKNHPGDEKVEKVSDPIMDKSREICTTVVESIPEKVDNHTEQLGISVIELGQMLDSSNKVEKSDASSNVEDLVPTGIKNQPENGKVEEVANTILNNSPEVYTNVKESMEQFGVPIVEVTLKEDEAKHLELEDQNNEINALISSANDIVLNTKETNNATTESLEDTKKRNIAEIGVVALDEDTNQDLVLGDQNSQIFANGDSVSKEVDNFCVQSTEDKKGNSMLTSEEGTDKALEEDKLNANITQEHSYGNHEVVSDLNSNIAPNTSEAICDNAGNVSINLQNEIKEISELIRGLERISEKFPYPNPFAAIPKMLKAVYIAEKKCACKVVQEKLHELAHEIITWTERFVVGDIHFVCQICHANV